MIVISLKGSLMAQSDSPSKGKYHVSLSGNLSAWGGYYNAFGGPFRTSPYSFGLGGNLNMKVGKYNVPISLVFRDHSLNLSRPFLFFGISPQLGNTRFHLGYRNLHFSKFTLGGATFFGAGVETRYSLLRLGAMYGTFENPLAQRDTIIFSGVPIPSFKRRGYSAKIGVGNDNNYLDFIVLKVKDDIRSLEPNTETPLRPKDNLVFGLHGRLNFSSLVSLTVDGAVSGLTNDLSANYLVIEEAFIQKIRSFLEVNETTNLFYAGESELRLNFKRIKPFLRYRRVSPYYQSFGINFINSDTEDVTFGLMGTAFNNKLRFNGQVGIERNNLLNHKSTINKRFIGTLAMAYQSKSPFRAQMQFNNYDISIQPAIIELNDTFRFARIMNQLRFSPSYTIKGTNVLHNVSLTGMIQGVNTDIIGRAEGFSNNNFANLNYALTLPNKKITASMGIEYNSNQDSRFIRERYGLNSSIARPFLKNTLNTSFQFSLYNNLINGKNDGAMIRNGFTTNYKLKNGHSFSWFFFYINRKSIVFENSSDIQSRIQYNLTLR
jgi:hypothetical protein